jgi:hypothetical protein
MQLNRMLPIAKALPITSATHTQVPTAYAGVVKNDGPPEPVAGLWRAVRSFVPLDCAAQQRRA